MLDSASKCIDAASNARWHAKKNRRHRADDHGAPYRQRLRDIARCGAGYRAGPRTSPQDTTSKWSDDLAQSANPPDDRSNSLCCASSLISRQWRSGSRHDRTYPPHRRHRRRTRRGDRPCLISRSRPSTSSATPIFTSASRRCARSSNMARARNANMPCGIGRSPRAGRSSVRIIDRDLGKSGASAVTRDGFQELVSEVALGKAGIVMGIEVSRLARNSADWHRLIELCALTATLILDEDGIYDPANFNDRLLLGLKGTMSEAELHILKARMRGGQLDKARRGELETGPPVGLVYRNDGAIGLDPDAQVQNAIRLVFETFDRTGSAMKTLRFFREQGQLFPRRLRTGADKGELLWAPPHHSRILQV